MRTYTNPVSDAVLGDPFVLKWNGRYYAYGTPPSGPIPVLTSTDLVTWTAAAQVLPAPPEGQCYWAPEVAYDNGTFYLYYSVGGPEGEGHRLRVATAPSPLGPFTPVGGPLDPGEPFSIDASPFRDDDGTWYLFSCRDFLDGDRVGTGIVVHRLRDMTTLDGAATTVVRPHAEWHVYERQRHWYDRVWDWYTVEGPFVVHHGGRYWCFFSGGAWRADNYGVSWAVADHPLGPWETGAPSDGAEVLRTVEGAIGPGHASLVAAPDNVGVTLVYHAWDVALTGRRMCIDALRWEDGFPAASGPTVGPATAPPLPHGRHLFDDPGLPAGWRVDGPWAAGGGDLVQPDEAAPARAETDLPAGDVRVEVNLAARGGTGRVGVAVGGVEVALDPARHVLTIAGVHHVPLRPDFAAEAYHQLLIDCSGDRLTVRLDGLGVGEVARVVGPGPLELFTDGASAAFSGITISAR